jgi:hypothetical protein
VKPTRSAKERKAKIYDEGTMGKKTVPAVLLLSLLLFGGIAEAEDVFVWPDLVEENQVHACRKETRSLRDLLRSNLINNSVSGLSDNDKIIDQFDLNGDGICELYIKNNQASGTGGYAEEFFQKKGNSYYLILEFFGFDLRPAEKKDGYLQVIYHQVVSGPGGETEIPVLYRFNGKEYVQVKTPAWHSKKYNSEGVQKYFSVFLKPAGYLAFTELCWFENEPPAEARTFFDNIYPDIKTAGEVRQLAVAAGYSVVDSFNLPESAWWDDYYTPMIERIKELKLKNAGVAEAEEVYAHCETEIEMFRRHSKSYGYTFFVLQRPAA